MDALNPAKRRAAQRPTPQRVYVKVTSEFDATGYMQPRAVFHSISARACPMTRRSPK